MSQQPERDRARDRLRDSLHAITTDAAVEVHRMGDPIGFRRHWPRCGVERNAAWLAILKELYGSPEAAMVVVELYRWPEATWGRHSFPAAAGPVPAGEEAATAVAAGLSILRVELAPENGEASNGIARPNKASSPCAKAVLAVLYQAHRRLTGGQLEEALRRSPGERLGRGWSMASIEGTLAWLQQMGLVDNVRHGGDGVRGYGLTAPDRVPVFEGEAVWQDEGE